ncbi:nectin-3-like protein isoform 2-T2 [Anomaloglossus baeobatrachus]|uniref:nectin-3-like protein isoform X2 n=1 Tax=Anomaloglossus baeobatrachus TaxID=238106 RepID=UPI003F50A341
MSLLLQLLCVALFLHVRHCQVIEDVHVIPPPEPILVGRLEQTVAICIVRADEPAAIKWRTRDLPYKVEEKNIRHESGIFITWSELKMIPERRLHGMEVTCAVQQHEGTLTVQNIHFAPEMVNIDVLENADESLQLSCHSEANPPAEYIWKRGDQVIKSGVPSVTLPKEAEPGLYKCEAKNYLGVNAANLQIVERKQHRSTMKDSLSWTIILGVTVLFFSRYFFRRD